MSKFLLKIITIGIFVLVSNFLFLSDIALPAMPDVIDPCELEEGMAGYGKTVFHGLEPIEFPVIVRGVLEGAGMDGGPLILIELTGEEIEKYGGISLGMSGSPVYFGDRLAGALSITFPMTDHSLGGVTPLASMLKIKDFEKSASASVKLQKPFDFNGKTYRQIEYVNGSPDECPVDSLCARTAMAPVAVTGLSERTMPFLKNLFRAGGLDPAQAQTIGSGIRTASADSTPLKEIVPGSSVAVQLVRGDIDISAVGTVTAVEGKDVYMFGHPFFRKGNVKYLLADAYVHAIVRGDNMPFKATSTGSLRGQVLQDRGSALFGKLDAYPALVPVDLTIRDMDLDRSFDYSFKIVRDEDILINLIATVLLQSIDNSIDRIGFGSSVVKFNIDFKGAREPLSRINMFYDRSDVTGRSLGELASALLLLRDNKFINADLEKLSFDIEIKSDHSFAEIEKAVINRAEPEKEVAEKETEDGSAGHEEAAEPEEINVKKMAAVSFGSPGDSPYKKNGFDVVHPGEKLELSVQLRPFRKEPLNEKLFLKVPGDIPTGRAIINIFSGAEAMQPALPPELMIDIQVEGPLSREESGEEIIAEEDKDETFEDLVREFLEIDLNNELVATIDSLGFESGSNGNSSTVADKPACEKAKKKTDWVLRGSARIEVEVRQKADSNKTTIKKSRLDNLRSNF
ncbi:MAG TPA: hypothetical protein PLN69_01415 [bacterium]|nr:hypothetical protein [bacterium]